MVKRVLKAICITCVICILSACVILQCSPERRIFWVYQINWCGVSDSFLYASQYVLENRLTTGMINSELHRNYFDALIDTLDVKQLYLQPDGMVFCVLEYKGLFTNGIEYGVYYSPEGIPLISPEYLSTIASIDYFSDQSFEYYENYYLLGKRYNGTDFYLTKPISNNLFYFEYHLSH